jgi:hypothetical protein
MAGNMLSSIIHMQNQRLAEMLHVKNGTFVQHRCIVEGCARLRRPGFTKCTHHLQGMFSERVKKGHITRRRARMRCFEEDEMSTIHRVTTRLTSPVRPMPFAAPLTVGSPSIGTPTLTVA